MSHNLFWFVHPFKAEWFAAEQERPPLRWNGLRTYFIRSMEYGVNLGSEARYPPLNLIIVTLTPLVLQMQRVPEAKLVEPRSL